MHIADLSQYAPLAAIAVLHRATHPAVILRIARVGESVVQLAQALRRPKVATGELLEYAHHSDPTPRASHYVAPQPNGETPMKLNLSDLAGAMASAASAVQNTTVVAAQLYSFGAQMIANVERAYSAAGAGAHKRAAVLAAVNALEKALAAGTPGDSESIMSEFAPWLDTVIGAYNAANDVLGGALPQADVPTLTEKLGQFAAKAEAVAAELAPAAETVLKTTESLFASSAAPGMTPAVPAANTNGV